jgi:hypothetical protein
MLAGTKSPVVVKVILFVADAAKPSCPLPTKYRPVVVSPEKFKDGFAAEPLPKVKEVNTLDVAVWAL